MSSKVKITVDLDRCVGSTMCIQIAPAVFALTAEGQSSVTDAGGDTLERIVDAAENCPMEAIRVEDLSTGSVLFP